MSTFHSRGLPTVDDANREAVRCGELLTVEDMSARMGRSLPEMERLLDRGSLFAINVDDTPYIPAFLDVGPKFRARLWDICELIRPARAESRLAFLLGIPEAPWNRNALDLLSDEQAYRRLRAAARAWASEWSRTTVLLFEDRADCVNGKEEPLFQSFGEIDPRYPAWSRANRSLGHNETRKKRVVIGRATLLVCRNDPPCKRTIEKRLVLTLADRGTSLAISADNGHTFLLPLPCHFDVHDAGQIVRRVVRQMERGGEAAGLSVKEAAQVLGCPTDCAYRLLLDRRLARVKRDAQTKLAVTLESIRSYRLVLVAQALLQKDVNARAQ